MIPEEMQLQKDMLKIEDLIACCHDEVERRKLQEELTTKSFRLQQLIEKRKLKETATFDRYRKKIFQKFM